MALCCGESVFICTLGFLFISNSLAIDSSYYAYKTDALQDSSSSAILLREARDVTAADVSTVSPSTPDASDKGLLKKPGEGKFPNTKEPLKPGKVTKKPILEPTKKPRLKPTKAPYPKDDPENKQDTTPVVCANATTVLPINATSPTSKENAAVPTSKTIQPHSSGVGTAVASEDLYDDVDEDMSSFNVSGYLTNNTQHFTHHRYYKSMSYSGNDMIDNFWVDFDSLPKNISIESSLLSSAHRQAFTLVLSFVFPFYGHRVQNITIATGGFLYTGEILHTWLAAAQYIAPLMANFDTSTSEQSKVRYADNGTALTVQWENVKLRKAGNTSYNYLLHDDPFTFQVTIHESGDIIFSYKDIPIAVTEIGDSEHPVKVGLSDAYIVEKTIFYVRRKTIYEYHKIDMKKPNTISNATAIVFKALPTCVSFNDCNSCLQHNTSFHCRWCGRAGRCSDGTDRFRQDWLLSRCDYFNTNDPSRCPYATTWSPIWSRDRENSIDTDDGNSSADAHPRISPADASKASGVGAGVTIAIILCLLLTVVGWVTYAYFFPHTTSGQLLIRYRPSTWSFKRGGARYTAAAMHSIHM